jgi:peptidoglycan/LPS O-acetylase OafA/YrhL
MPFDPKLVNEDEAGFEGDLKLPDDLALMAEQLGDDAARLAATYPPPVPAVLAASREASAAQSSSRRKAWLTRSLAGTALAVGIVTISLVASNSYQPQNANHPLPAVAPLPASGSLVVHEAPTPKGTQPQKIPVTPASWLGDTSGPELEALMDLWEHDQPAVRSLSF